MQLSKLLHLFFPSRESVKEKTICSCVFCVHVMCAMQVIAKMPVIYFLEAASAYASERRQSSMFVCVCMNVCVCVCESVKKSERGCECVRMFQVFIQEYLQMNTYL